MRRDRQRPHRTLECLLDRREILCSTGTRHVGMETVRFAVGEAVTPDKKIETEWLRGEAVVYKLSRQQAEALHAWLGQVLSQGPPEPNKGRRKKAPPALTE